MELIGEDSGDGGGSGRFGWLSVKPFLKYFDLDDKVRVMGLGNGGMCDLQEVLRRLVSGLMGPFNGTFAEYSRENPDLCVEI